MVSHHPAKFGRHRYCVSGDMFHVSIISDRFLQRCKNYPI